jgi:hypothetical protein
MMEAAMIDIDVSVDVKQVAGVLGQFSKQVPFAAAVAITRTVKQGADDMRADFASKFDRPTRYTLNAVFSKPANKLNLTGAFGLKDAAMLQKSGGYSPADILGHHFKGGVSRFARYEQAFMRIGILGLDEDIVPGSNLRELNQYGGVPSGLIIKLISYFGAFSESGFKANATQASKDKLAKRTDRNTKGKRASKYARINGVVYFYSNERGTTRHLHKGIWAKTGIHGVDIRPILMFVKRGVYKKRFDLNTYAAKARANFAQHFDASFKQALASAR